MQRFRYIDQQNFAYLEASGLRLCYEQFGDPADPPVLMIMGLGAQMTAWPLPLCQAIARQGFRVIRFDNRDIGLSSKLQSATKLPWHQLVAAGLFGFPLRPPYSLDDMLADTIGLLDALNIEKAHVIGSSMGGMIGQLMAIHFPGRVLSITNLMTSSGAPGLPRGRLPVLWRLCRPRPESENPEAALSHLFKICRMIGSRKFADDDRYLKERLRFDIARCYDPAGVARQTAAVVAAPSRRALLANIKLPALVVHGTADPVLPYQHGIDLAAAIPDAELELIEGMGHDLPLNLVFRLSNRLVKHLRFGVVRQFESACPNANGSSVAYAP